MWPKTEANSGSIRVTCKVKKAVRSVQPKKLKDPMLNMMAVLTRDDGKKSCCEVKRERCDCAGRDVVVVMPSWDWLMFFFTGRSAMSGAACFGSS